ncbi:MAG: polysaccharide pyruvyl transferase CsaB [Eubacteriales bacterium]|nr:polysaccharide pyruvyl transferase CsaB [Eubacteriales bacterium]
MKIIHIIGSGDDGRAASAVLTLAEELRDMTVVTASVRQAETAATGADLLYCHGADAAVCGCKISKESGIPFIFDCTNANPAAYTKKVRRILCNADSCVADGSRIAEYALSDLGVDPARTFSICQTAEELEHVYRQTKHMAERRANGRDGAVICGAYGRGNAGDDAILNAIIHELHQVDPDLPVSVASRRPNDTRRRNPVQSYHMFHFGALGRALDQAELFISGGGSLIQNATSSRSLYYYLLTLMLAKRHGCKVMMYGCGIGPVYGRFHRWAAARVIDNYVDIITLRDEDSVSEIKRMGVSRPSIVRTADPTICIQPLEAEQTEKLLERLGIPSDGKYIGFGLRDWKGFDRAAPEIARAAQYAWSEYGLIPVFVPIEFPHDCEAAKRVIKYLGCPYHLITERITIKETISVLSRMSLVVGMRLHSLIFAVENGVPSIGISYDLKVDGFLRSIGREDATLHIQNVTSEELMKQIDRAAAEEGDSRWHEIARQLAEEERGNLEQVYALLTGKQPAGERKRKVYLTSLHLKHGGVEMVIATLANALVKQGFDVEVLCTYRLGEPAYPMDERVQITYLTEDSPNRQEFAEALREKNPARLFREGARAAATLWRKMSTMKRAIRNISDGIVISTRHEHSVLLSRYGAPGVIKIAQLHSDHNFDKKLVHDFQKKYQNIDYFVLLTEQTTSEVKGFMQGHNDRTKCITIPNFIEPPDIQLPVRKEKQVIAAGRLHPDKDFPTLLRIWKRVCGEYPDWMLKIAGEGNLEQELKQYARELGIEEHVCFTGVLEHNALLREMAKSACFALTSVSESFGLVLVEAMSCGTPPVSFDIRVGPATIIEDTVSGFLVPNRDEALFAEKLKQLMADTTLQEQMGRNATVRAERFYRDNVLRQWLELLSE